MKSFLLLFIPLIVLTGCTPTQSNTNYSPSPTPSLTPPVSSVTGTLSDDDLLTGLDSVPNLDFEAEFDALVRDLQ